MRKWIVLLMATVAMTGCTSSRSSSSTGLISGTGSPCVGPVSSSGAIQKLTVAVTLLTSAGRTRVQTVSFPWKFTFVVTPGTYVLLENGAPRVTVHVKGGMTTHATLTALCL